MRFQYFYLYLGSNRPISGSESLKLTNYTFGANLTDVTLAEEDTNSILADNAKGAIQGNEAMQCDAIFWPNLQLL